MGMIWAIIRQRCPRCRKGRIFKGLMAMGQNPVLSAMAGTYVHALMWGLLPFYGYIVLLTVTVYVVVPGANVTVPVTGT